MKNPFREISLEERMARELNDAKAAWLTASLQLSYTVMV